MELPLKSILAVHTIPVPVSTLKLLDIVGHDCPVLDVVLLDTTINFCCGELLLLPMSAVPLYRLPFLNRSVNSVSAQKACALPYRMAKKLPYPYLPKFESVWVHYCLW